MKSAFYTVLHFLFVWPVRLIFRIRVKGAKNEPKRKEGPYLVCANHQSVLDAVFICAATRRQQPHFMAKAELFRVFFLGRLVRWLGAYPVSRGKSDVGAVKRTIKLLEDGYSVGMFPQGTRCPDRDPKECRVKYGAAMVAAHAGATILPVHIKMKNYHWRFLRPVKVVIGEPIPFEKFGYDSEKPGEYARIADEIYREICRLGEDVK
jgi:1-acyl-sn-glycerol-3-phosphate acyltransferase